MNLNWSWLIYLALCSFFFLVSDAFDLTWVQFIRQWVHLNNFWIDYSYNENGAYFWGGLTHNNRPITKNDYRQNAINHRTDIVRPAHSWPTATRTKYTQISMNVLYCIYWWKDRPYLIDREQYELSVFHFYS